jgi:WD40 repeat protein
MLRTAVDQATNRRRGPTRIVGACPHAVDLDRPLDAPTEVLIADADAPDSIIIDQFGDFTLHVGLVPSEDDGVVYSRMITRRGLDGEIQGPPILVDAFALRSVSPSPRGDRLMLDETDELVLYDVTTGERVAVLDPGIPWSRVVFTNGKFSLDGSVVNLTSQFESASFDADTGELLWADDLYTHAYPLADATSMLTSEGFGEPVIRIRDTSSFEEIGDPLIGHQSGISWVNVHPDRPWLATTGRDRTVRVWNLDTSSQIGRELPNDQSGVGIWSPDGKLLAVPSPDGFVVWNYDTDTWADIACEVAGRNLTRAEWDEFGPRTIEYRPTCEQYPPGE